MLTDPSGAVIPGATIIAVNPATGFQNKTTTDEKGFYSFPILPVGRYDVSADVPGFTPQKRQGIAVDADSALDIGLTVEMNEKVEEVTVIENAAHVETESTQMGEVVTGTAMTSVALNGRSYHRSAGAAAGHRADVHANARFDRHGRRLGRDRAFGRL